MPSTSKLLQVFKPGRHTAASGEHLNFTAAELQASAKAYDPQLHEAPIVVGHPAHDKPAYGWVQSLQFAAGHLEVTPTQVDPQFADLVDAGRYKKISASFYRPGGAGNPVPEVYYLRHVGFLGAAPPALKGLRAPSFAEGDAEDFVEFSDIDFSAIDGYSIASLFRGIRDWMIGKDGVVAANAVMPDYLIANLEAAAAREAAENSPSYNAPAPTPPAPTAPAEPPHKETPAVPTPEELAAQATDLQRREAAVQATESKLATDANTSFLEGLVREGRLLPAFKEPLVSFMSGLKSDVTVDFTEAGVAVKSPQLAFIKKFLMAQPKLVEFDEFGRLPVEQDEAGEVSFSAPTGFRVDKQDAELHAKATAYQQKHPGTDIVTAFKAVGGK